MAINNQSIWEWDCLPSTLLYSMTPNSLPSTPLKVTVSLQTLVHCLCLFSVHSVLNPRMQRPSLSGYECKFTDKRNTETIGAIVQRKVWNGFPSDPSVDDPFPSYSSFSRLTFMDGPSARVVSDKLLPQTHTEMDILHWTRVVAVWTLPLARLTVRGVSLSFVYLTVWCRRNGTN